MAKKNKQQDRWRKLTGGMVCLCMLLSLLGGVPVTAEKTEEDLFRSYPSSAMFDSLWVGDTVAFKSLYYHSVEGVLPSDNSLTVVSGSGVEIVGVYLGCDDYYKGLKFTKPGKSSVRVKVTDPDTGASAEKTFAFTVSPRPADKPVTVSHDFPASIRLKMGGDAAEFGNRHVRFGNLNYGSEPVLFQRTSGGLNISGTADFITTGSWGGASWGCVNDQRICSTVGATDLSSFYPGVSCVYACRPGTLTIQPVYNSQNVGGPICTVTVEEPVITANVPTSVKVGNTIRLETALTNTSLKNLKVSEYEKEEDSWYEGVENPVAYKPSVTIVEGQDCVVQSKQDYSNTLTSSETLTFKKTGTVKLKVAYKQINVADQINEEWFQKRAYNPEKIITIRVTDDSTTGSQPTETKPSGSRPSDSTSGSGSTSGTAEPSASYPSTGETTVAPPPTLPPVEEQPVVMTDEETGIKIGAEEGVLPPDTSLVVKPSNFVLTDAAGKFTAFDISLDNGGAKIQPNGKVQVSIPVPADYDRERLTVYHIAEDGTKSELPCSVSGDTITFETDHFSLYVVAEKAADDNTLSGGEPNQKSGSPVIWIALGIVLVVAAGGAFALWWFKLRKKSEADPE